MADSVCCLLTGVVTLAAGSPPVRIAVDPGEGDAHVASSLPVSIASIHSSSRITRPSGLGRLR